MVRCSSTGDHVLGAGVVSQVPVAVGRSVEQQHPGRLPSLPCPRSDLCLPLFSRRKGHHSDHGRLTRYPVSGGRHPARRSHTRPVPQRDMLYSSDCCPSFSFNKHPLQFQSGKADDIPRAFSNDWCISFKAVVCLSSRIGRPRFLGSLTAISRTRLAMARLLGGLTPARSYQSSR